jgi:hypothetical protein
MIFRFATASASLLLHHASSITLVNRKEPYPEDATANFKSKNRIRNCYEFTRLVTSLSHVIFRVVGAFYTCIARELGASVRLLKAISRKRGKTQNSTLKHLADRPHGFRVV